ncbi:ATP-binding protein [Sporomusa sp.]|uniref:ATP-binding protein n=1 Tax=Sporomusa sp. TaxID=2078658 RepID=UPI002BF646E2|nr:ATP-binding protein [Sporomusa sp.]HWR43754.1 ATP-binding protein [Sporomusa sp.]
MIPCTVATRTYLITTIFITLLMFILGWTYASETKGRIFAEKEKTLLYIVTTLEQKLPYSYERILLEENAQDLNAQEKVLILNKRLQPIINKVRESYPGYGMGYGTFENRLAFYPFKQEGLYAPLTSKVLKVYESKMIELVYNPTSHSWGTAPTMSVTYPLFFDGKIIGHTWANVKLDEINKIVYLAWFRIFSLLFIVWLGLIYLLRKTFSKFKSALSEFATHIEKQDDSEGNLENFPELKSLRTTIVGLRESIKKRESEYRTLVENCPDTIVRLDRDGRLLYINPEGCKHDGNLLEWYIGKCWRDLGIPEGVWRQWEEAVKTVIATGDKIEREYNYGTFSNRAKDVLISWTPEKDENGQVQTILGISRDITEQKQAHECFIKAFNINPNIMAIVSIPDNTYVDVNESFQKAIGLTRGEIIGKTVDNISLWYDSKERQEVRKKIFRQGYLSNYEIKFCTAKKGVRFGVLSVETITVGYKPCSLIVITDITDNKQLESEMARFDRLNVIGEMAAGIGHEVRNPMTTVRGYLQLFLRKSIFEPYHEQLSTMIEELDRANSIITEFLSLAKNKTTDMRRVNLNNVVNVLFPLVQADAFRIGHQIHVEMSDIPDTMLDEKEIRQLILNLVRNALEAMEQQGVVTLKTYCSNDDIVLEISDTGKGIPKDILNQLGTPFLTTKDNGTGLGLAVCYRIAQRHGAVIHVDTSSNGTRFFIEFKTSAT